MKKFHILLFVTLLIQITACSPDVSTDLLKSYPFLNSKQEVIVIGLHQPQPVNFEFLGMVKIRNTTIAPTCGYQAAIEEARYEARKAGGNVIKLIVSKPPTALENSCHRITAKILKVDEDDYNLLLKEYDKLLDIDYAILKVFRYYDGGSLVEYDLHLGDSVICRVENNYKTTLHINKEGRNKLWASTGGIDEVSVILEIGKTYYLRCGLGAGGFVNRPKLELVDDLIGKAEFESF